MPVKGKTWTVISDTVRAVGVADSAFKAVFCYSEREWKACAARQWYDHHDHVAEGVA